jgi:hypothetical protein
MRHSGMDAGIQAKDGNQPVAQVFYLGSVQAQRRSSMPFCPMLRLTDTRKDVDNQGARFCAWDKMAHFV